MKAAIFTQFRAPLTISDVPDPKVPEDGVILAVDATGICRSDWHGWQGHDADIRLPHVPGHELAGTIVEIGKNIRNWKRGERVTMPFVAGCGHCAPLPFGQPAGLRPSVPAWLHPLGFFRPIRGHPLRRHEPGPPPGQHGLRGRRKPRLPFRDRLQGAGSPGQGARRRLGSPSTAAAASASPPS